MKNDAEQPNYRMSPGELAQFSRSGAAIEVAKVNPEVYTSWTKSNLRFDDTSLSEIIWRIEQTYGVDVFVRDKSLLSKKISGSIQNNDLNVFLKALSELLHTTVEQKSTTIIIGT
jgi:ferric-dicitrate binding protein FerR (iron transport regulator)